MRALLIYCLCGQFAAFAMHEASNSGIVTSDTGQSGFVAELRIAPT